MVAFLSAKWHNISCSGACFYYSKLSFTGIPRKEAKISLDITKSSCLSYLVGIFSLGIVGPGKMGLFRANCSLLFNILRPLEIRKFSVIGIA
jgi:hypothetical protein